MVAAVLDSLSNATIEKAKLLKKSKLAYNVSGIMAGFYVGIGLILAMTVGSLTKASGPHFKVLMGVSFGIALSLVIMTGSELFTGNNFIVGAAALNKKVTWKQALNIWIFSYFGNFLGSTLIGSLFVMTGTPTAESTMGKFVIALAKAKMNAPAGPLFFKGILCNVLVCVAIFCAFKMKEETGKLIMIWWCLFAFITSGYEHSIANMTIFTIALPIANDAAVSVAGYGHNMLWVTLGNFVGGFGLAVVYYILGKNSDN